VRYTSGIREWCKFGARDYGESVAEAEKSRSATVALSRGSVTIRL
jgi:hypothetical protein